MPHDEMLLFRDVRQFLLTNKSISGVVLLAADFEDLQFSVDEGRHRRQKKNILLNWNEKDD